MFDGRLWIVTHRQKTNTKVMVPLLPPALKILNKYEGCYNDGQLMPIITNQKLNCYLKEIADICGIEKNQTFHIVRHTYATLQMAMSSNPYVVSQALTHKNLETTLRYTHEVPTALLETLGKIKIKPK